MFNLDNLNVFGSAKILYLSVNSLTIASNFSIPPNILQNITGPPGPAGPTGPTGLT
jgi:hypothetical protein